VQNPGRLVMYDWSMCKSWPSGDVCLDEYAPTSSQHPSKMQSNLRARHEYLEAFFQADSGNESDGEEKLKNGRQLTR
jgi:hypothetical protein